MLEILDTGKMAYKYGKHRGWIIAAYGVATWLAALAVNHFQDAIFAVAPAGAEPSGFTPITWLAIVMFTVGIMIVLWGAWQLYKDETRSDYRYDADHYKMHGW